MCPVSYITYTAPKAWGFLDMAFSLGWRAEKVGCEVSKAESGEWCWRQGGYTQQGGVEQADKVHHGLSPGALYIWAAGSYRLYRKGFPLSGSPSRKYCHRPAQSHFSHLIPDPIKLMIDSGSAQRSLSFNICANNRLKSILRSRRLLQSGIS